MALTKVRTNGLGLTISSGTGSQDPTSNNTVFDLVTGLTIPDNALIVIGYELEAISGENGDPGADATTWCILRNSSNTIHEII